MGVNIFQNSPGDLDAEGVEAEVSLATSRDLRLFGSYAWARAKDASGDQLEDVPVQKLNLGVIYRVVPARLTLAAALRWVDAYRVRTDIDEPEGSLMLDLNAGWDFGGRYRLEVQARNVLDQEAKLPKHGRADVPLPPVRVLGTLACAF
jgi:outer membrane receptor protein involved in Fe transport